LKIYVYRAPAKSGEFASFHSELTFSNHANSLDVPPA